MKIHSYKLPYVQLYFYIMKSICTEQPAQVVTDSIVLNLTIYSNGHFLQAKNSHSAQLWIIHVQVCGDLLQVIKYLFISGC